MIDVLRFSRLFDPREQEAAFRKVVQATMVRDRQHGPVVELNRIQVGQEKWLRWFYKFFIKGVHLVKNSKKVSVEGRQHVGHERVNPPHVRLNFIYLFVS